MRSLSLYLTSIAIILLSSACESESNDSPKPEADVIFQAEQLLGNYFGDYYTPGADNYYIILTDNGKDENYDFYPNTTAYIVDAYAAVTDGLTANKVTIPQGIYTFDSKDSYKENSIAASGAFLVESDESGNYDPIYFEDATLIVEERKITLHATIDGEIHLVTYEGELTLQNDAPASPEDMELEVPYVDGIYYGDLVVSGVGNYFFTLSDQGWYIDEEEVQWDAPNGHFYRFDLYGPLHHGDTSAGIAVPTGVYRLDSEDSYESGTFSFTESQYWQTGENGETIDAGAISAGILTVTEQGMTAELTINGAVHTLTYAEGRAYLTDRSQVEE